MALVLVPADRIREGLQIINEEAPELNNIFQEFHRYNQITWIDGVTPEIFSVYKLIRKTNNNVENFHRRIFQTMNIHPNICKFTG